MKLGSHSTWKAITNVHAWCTQNDHHKQDMVIREQNEIMWGSCKFIEMSCNSISSNKTEIWLETKSIKVKYINFLAMI